jgi:hypothetical protein
MLGTESHYALSMEQPCCHYGNNIWCFWGIREMMQCMVDRITFGGDGVMFSRAKSDRAVVSWISLDGKMSRSVEAA